MGNEKLEFDESKLPDHLRDLASLFGEWCIGDDVERSEAQQAASDSALQVLTSRVLPRIDEINAYLDTFADRQPDWEACLLSLLAECAMEADMQVYMREETEGFPEEG
jgi:hypothetical protein